MPVPEGGLTLYRLLRHADARLEDFEPEWTRPQAQLRRIPELFWASASHWLTLEQAVVRSTRRPAFVARIELEPDSLIRVALTERAAGDFRQGHVDAWAYPRQLLSAVADVTRVKV